MIVRKHAMQGSLFSVLGAGALLLLLAVSVAAQLPTGTFLGVVKDTSGAVVPGATVTIHSTETDQTRTATTDTNGTFRVPALPVGHYDIRVEHGGFKTDTQAGLNLEVGQEAVVDFTLQVGTAEQTVQVTGEAQQVNTTNSTLGSVVSEQTIADLPLNGRNYTDLTLLQPGITQHKNLSNAGGNQPGTVFSSNGAPIQSNSFSLDGASLVSTYNVSAASGTGNALGVEGIREYKVVTTITSAEYGMTMGSQTLLVSKGGTNSFHGDGFEFLRNSALDAANFFDKPTPANGEERTPVFRRNNFGGTLGGPIQKDKTFFFAAYEGLRENIGQTIQSTTFQLSCLPASSGGTATINNDPCATASTPVGTVNPTAWQILQQFPKPNLPGTTNQFTYPSPEPLSENWGQGRIDHTFSASDTLFGRYTFDDSYFQYGLLYPPFVQTQATRSQFATIAENHVFSSALLNTFRFSFSRTATTTQGPTDFPGFPQLVPNQQLPGFATLQISGLTSSTAVGAGTGFGPTATLPNFPRQNIWTYSDDLFYEKGKHSLKFGTLINHYQIDYLDYTDNRGNILFASSAAFLAGQLQSGSEIIYYNAPRRHFRNDTFGFYVQDDYKVTPRLTLNLGLRYEFATEVTDPRAADLNDHANLSSAFPNFPTGDNYKAPYYHNFSPRVGFAWDVFGTGKTSLRGGGALLYDVETLGALLQGIIQNPPLANVVFLSSGTLAAPLNLTAAAPASLNATNTGGGIAYNLKAPRTYTWNLTAGQQLPWNTALEVSYIGSRGIHLIMSADGNPVVYSIQNGQPYWPTFNSTTNVPRLVNSTWGISPYANGGNSYYQALEVSVTKRVSHGLQFQSEYTYSKLLDNADGNAPSQSGSTSNTPVSVLDLYLDRALASFDTRQNYRFNTLYNLPTVNSSNGFVKGALNGWWTAIILAAQTGTPFTPSVSGNESRSEGGGSFSNGDRPDWAPGRNPYNATHGVSSGCTTGSGTSARVIPAGTPLGNTTLYFDPCAFLLEAPGYEGNVGRNSLIGPGLLDLDYSLVKDTAVKWLGEAGKVEFRAEFFNIMNHPNFAQPVRTVFSGLTGAAQQATSLPAGCTLGGCAYSVQTPGNTTGIIQSTATGTTATQSSGNSRQIQFGLKIVF